MVWKEFLRLSTPPPAQSEPSLHQVPQVLAQLDFDYLQELKFYAFTMHLFPISDHIYAFCFKGVGLIHDQLCVPGFLGQFPTCAGAGACSVPARAQPAFTCAEIYVIPLILLRFPMDGNPACWCVQHHLQFTLSKFLSVSLSIMTVWFEGSPKNPLKEKLGKVNGGVQEVS